MGLGQRKSKGGKGGHRTKNKEYKKGHATKNRRKDVDQIQDELAVEQEKGEETVFDVDDDLPGQGQFYCTPCARHFTDGKTRETHLRSKLHKRRMKDVAQEQYTQAEAERGAGMSREKYPPAHPVRAAATTAATAATAAKATATAIATPQTAASTGGVEGAATKGPVLSVMEEEEDPDL